MSWTYMALCNRVLRRLNEVNFTSSTFTTPVGFQASVQDCVNDALNDIYDAELNWPFLYMQGNLTTSAYVNTYVLPTNYTEVDWNSFIRLPNVLASPVQTGAKTSFMSYHEWLEKWATEDDTIIQYYNEVAEPVGGVGQGGPPDKVFQYPDRLHVGLSTPPDVAYNFQYDYWYKPTDLALYSDTIVIPDMFSKVVIDGSTMYAYMFRDNVEEAQAMQKKFTDGIAEMRRRQINKEDYMRSDQLVLFSAATPGYN